MTQHPDAIDGEMTNTEDHDRCLQFASECFADDPEGSEYIARIPTCGQGCCWETHFLTPKQALPVLREVRKRELQHIGKYNAEIERLEGRLE